MRFKLFESSLRKIEVNDDKEITSTYINNFLGIKYITKRRCVKGSKFKLIKSDLGKIEKAEVIDNNTKLTIKDINRIFGIKYATRRRFMTGPKYKSGNKAWIDLKTGIQTSDFFALCLNVMYINYIKSLIEFHKDYPFISSN